MSETGNGFIKSFNELDAAKVEIEKAHSHLDRCKIMKVSIDRPGEPLSLSKRCDIAATRDLDAEYMLGANQKKVAELEQQLDTAIKVLKRTYRKHWLDDDSIGWDELGGELRDILCELIGETEFQKLLNEVKDDNTI
jgi:hypothetical protein